MISALIALDTFSLPNDSADLRQALNQLGVKASGNPCLKAADVRNGISTDIKPFGRLAASRKKEGFLNSGASLLAIGMPFWSSELLTHLPGPLTLPPPPDGGCPPGGS